MLLCTVVWKVRLHVVTVTNFKVQFSRKPWVFNRFNTCNEMAKMISSCAFHNRFSSTTIHITSCIGLKSLTKSRITNFPSTTQNHHCCPKRELPRKSIEMVNHLFYSISTAFRDREISFVRCFVIFIFFTHFWPKICCFCGVNTSQLSKEAF